MQIGGRDWNLFGVEGWEEGSRRGDGGKSIRFGILVSVCGIRNDIFIMCDC